MLLKRKRAIYSERDNNSDSDFDSDDSVKDRDYTPHTSPSESDESTPEKVNKQF